MLINEATWCGSYTKCKQLHQALTLFHSYARKFAQLHFAQFGLLLNPEKKQIYPWIYGATRSRWCKMCKQLYQALTVFHSYYMQEKSVQLIIQRSCWGGGGGGGGGGGEVVVGGGGGILVSLRPSVRPSRIPRVRSVASTVLVGSISYLYIL